MMPRTLSRLLPFLLLLVTACGASDVSASFSDEERAAVEARGGKIAELRLGKVP